jgi:hypothetical protein
MQKWLFLGLCLLGWIGLVGAVWGGKCRVCCSVINIVLLCLRAGSLTVSILRVARLHFWLSVACLTVLRRPLE